MGGQGRCKTPDLPSEAKLVLEATRGSGHQCSLGQGGWVSLSLGRPNCSKGGAGETCLGHHWACNVPVAVLQPGPVGKAAEMLLGYKEENWLLEPQG